MDLPLVTPYDFMELGQYWCRSWLSWRHQVITWTTVGLLLIGFCDIPLGDNYACNDHHMKLQDVFEIYILKITAIYNPVKSSREHIFRIASHLNAMCLLHDKIQVNPCVVRSHDQCNMVVQFDVLARTTWLEDICSHHDDGHQKSYQSQRRLIWWGWSVGATFVSYDKRYSTQK